MKKARLFLFVLLIGSFVFASDTLVVSGSTGWFPLYLKDADGNAYGVTVDITKKVAEKLGIELKTLIDHPWKRTLNDAIDGTVDIVCGAYYNEERAQIYDYSIPFMQNQTRIFMMKDNAFTVNSLDDLKGKILGIPFGGSFGEAFDNYKDNLDIDDGSKDKTILFKKLLAGRLDGALSDLYDGTNYLKQEGLNDQIVVSDYIVNSINVHFLISKATSFPNLKETVNQVIQEMINSGEMDTILDQYK